LEKGFNSINKIPIEYDYNNCISILTKYNTRINPRENEINSNQIFSEIMEILEINKLEKDILEDNFFDYYLQNNRLFDDTLEVLEEIKKCNFKIGILSDVPYGSVKVIEEDINKLGKKIDAIVSSVEIGYRKPNITGYIKLAEKLGIQTNEMIYIGNEKKDIIGANNARIISVLINRTDQIIDYGEKYQFKNLKEMWITLKNVLE
jgi:putative hydrolase of the HAD superfamily